MLDPIDRISEVLFGLIMVLTFTGSLSVAEAGRDDVRAMLIGALGCNLAWGIIDGVLYLMGCLAERSRQLTTFRAVRDADPEQARASSRTRCRRSSHRSSNRHELEGIRARLAQLPEPPERARVGRTTGSARSACSSSCSSPRSPWSIPFIFMRDAMPAMRVSNAIAIAMLFVTGYRLRTPHRVPPGRLGISMVVLGIVLVGSPWRSEDDAHARQSPSRRRPPPRCRHRPGPGDHHERPPRGRRGREGLVVLRLRLHLLRAGRPSYVQPHITADRGWLHLEARYNYEDRDTGSAWFGYNFSVGETVTLEITPMLGGVFGDTNGIAPGYKGSLGWWRLAALQRKRVRDRHRRFVRQLPLHLVGARVRARSDWFRFGLVVQRTQAYETDRDVQRGVFVGFSYKGADLTAYVFNPGTSRPDGGRGRQPGVLRRFNPPAARRRAPS